MNYECSKCNRYGMEWDGRAKILICCYKNCNHVVRIPNQITIPDENTILNAIRKDRSFLNGPKSFQAYLEKGAIDYCLPPIKNRSFLKIQAHCNECGFCFYDSFFLHYRCCIDAHKLIEPRTFACKRFYYTQADIRPNWENEFIFGAERTW